MSNRPVIVINAADLPNKVLEVSYEVPTYGDYRKAKKLYPYPTREGEQRPPYSVEELLFSLMLVKISKDGKSIELNSQDIPSRIEPFPIDDRQASMIEFIGTCFIDDDQAKLARSYASEKRNSALEPSVLIPSSITPNGRSYTFQRPNTGVQWRADTNFKGNQENGCTLDEYMMAMCVTHIDNKVIEQPKDPVSLFDDEFIDTVQFLSTIFVNVFLLEEGESEEAKKAGKAEESFAWESQVCYVEKTRYYTQPAFSSLEIFKGNLPFSQYIPAMPISSNILLGGRLSSYPSYYPINIRIFFRTQAEADNFVLTRQLGIDKEAEQYSKKYDIASFIALCQYSPIDILDWLGLREDPFVKNYGLPDVIRRALSFEISNIARDQESKRREQERKLEMKEMEYNSQLKFGNPNSTFGKVYS